MPGVFGAPVPAALGAPVPGRADPAATERIYEQLGVQEVAADYVVLVDVSGSLRTGNLYAALKTGLRNLFAALAPKDEVTVVTFAERAVQVWRQPAGESPDAIVAKLPPVANGAYTDIGLALESAVRVLRRPEAPSIGTVILLTDGRHDPKPGSRYPVESGYAWNQLTKAAGGLEKDALSAYAIPLAGGTSAHLLKKVFGTRASVLPTTNPDQIGARLAEPKQRVRAAKAQELLAGDLARNVSVQWPGQLGRLDAGSNELTATLRSQNDHLPLTVTDLAVGTTCGATVTSTLDGDPVELPPGGSAPVRLTVDWNPGDRSWKPSEVVRQQCALTLTGRVGTPWAAFLADELGASAKLTSTLAGPDGAASLRAQQGRPGWWQLGAGLLLLLVALAALLRWHRLHPVLSGVLTATATGGSRGSGSVNGGSVTLHGRRMTISAATLGIPGSGTARGRRPTARSGRTDLEIAYSRDGSTDAREVKVCPAGGSATVGDIRFEWRAGGR
ncbi:vWA domain-containing protein [Plantactinospora soyae]|uniref:VWFA domain-containing protein n=1 Tax=Plantactinospora soyae TaxID=1544732 RepID=A0A927MHS6_9ACTN|nr:vWA domain-containing protein [Plantactinospora soyae]MBE1491918.1 hypothetical protein [Plantactinospora soyae]